MDEQKISRELTVIFQQVFDDDNIVLTPDTTADDIQDWDSVNHITLIVATESHFKIKFRSAELEEMKNVGDFIRTIARKLALKDE
jgi:acyl carrier protein